MTEYTLQCTAAPTDRFVAMRDGDDVYLQSHEGEDFKVSAFAKPNDARTFARGILALADEIDGGEAPEPLKVGDWVRVVRNGFSYEGDTNVGREGILREIEPGLAQSHRVAFDESDYGWWCAEVERVTSETSARETDLVIGDKPAPHEVTTPETARSPFARYVTEARELLAETGHTGADVIELARELANRA